MSTRNALIKTYGSQVFNFVFNFGSTIIVARIVSPRDFGIFTLAGAITTIINLILQLGLAKYLVREAELSTELLRSLFTVNVVMSMVYTASLMVASALAYWAFAAADVGKFLFVFSFFPLIGIFEFIPAALCTRNMRFGVIAIMSVARTAATAITLVALAMTGFGYMSFAWSQIAAWIVAAVGFNFIVWRPDVWRFRFRDLRAILRFGIQMIGISSLSQVNTRAGVMVLGSSLGLSALGLYSRASSIPLTIHWNLFGAISNVIFSRMSHDLRDNGQFHESYVYFMSLLVGILWPALIGLAILSTPVVYTLYGSKWLSAALPLSLLAIATALSLLLGLVAEVFILRHQTSRQVKFEIIRNVLGGGLFIAGATFSLLAAAAAKIVEAVIAIVLYRKPLSELIGAPAGVLRWLYIETALVTVAATGPALALMIWFQWSPLTPLLHLAGAILLGATLWAALLWMIKHPLASEVSRMLQRT